jgi:hypothetical protein
VNPSFPITAQQAHAAVLEMRQTPKPLRRPLVLIGGLLDPNIGPSSYRDFFGRITIGGTFIRVAPGFCGTFEECRRMVIDAVDAACPSSDPNWTVEVDVVGASLGGVVARYAATPSIDPSHPRRLKIGRLFTISSPHSGALLAESFTFNELDHDLQPGSAFLKTLADQDASARYELIPYVHLRDDVIGSQNAAPPGRVPYWLDNQSILPAHLEAMMDERILADIARRLRDEKPFTIPPPAALPPEDYPRRKSR